MSDELGADPVTRHDEPAEGDVAGVAAVGSGHGPDEVGPNGFGIPPWTKKPRCDSMDPYGVLQCGRSSHEDDQCQYGGIAWKRGHTVAMPAAKALWEAAEAWRTEGRSVMFNKAGDDLSPHQRVEKWLRDRAAAGGSITERAQ